jgi:hypothetical protein
MNLKSAIEREREREREGEGERGKGREITYFHYPKSFSA